MRRLSSRATFFFKRIFPVLWFGVLAFVVAAMLTSMGRREDFWAAFVLVPVAMAILGFLLFKKLLSDLVDEVWDAGDRLIVKNGGEEEQIPLKEIMNVSYTLWINPPRVTLMLRRPGRFGKEVTFSPPARLLPFSQNPMIDNLIDRIDATRRV